MKITTDKKHYKLEFMELIKTKPLNSTDTEIFVYIALCVTENQHQDSTTNYIPFNMISN